MSLSNLNLNLELSTACKGDDVKEVKRLLKEGASVLALSEGCLTPLHNVAVYNQSNSAEIAQALLDHDAPVNAQTSGGFTSLYWSCMKSNVALSRRLLMGGADPNIQSTNAGWSALHHACYHGPLELALLLVCFGGNVYLANNSGQTPLNYCEHGIAQISRNAIENAYTNRGEKWLRRKSFIVFRSAIYGSATFQARQKRLDSKQCQASVLVCSTNPKEWEVADKVFGNQDLCRYILAYL